MAECGVSEWFREDGDGSDLSAIRGVSDNLIVGLIVMVVSDSCLILSPGGLRGRMIVEELEAGRRLGEAERARSRPCPLPSLSFPSDADDLVGISSREDGQPSNWFFGCCGTLYPLNFSSTPCLSRSGNLPNLKLSQRREVLRLHAFLYPTLQNHLLLRLFEYFLISIPYFPVLCYQLVHVRLWEFRREKPLRKNVDISG